MLKKIIEQARHALVWNAFGGFFFQGVLTAHQLALALVTTPRLYGIISTLFSLLYLTIAVLDTGFKDSLSSFYSLSIKSRQNFSHIILKPLINQLVVIIGLLTIASITYAIAPHYWHIYIPAIPFYSILIIAGLVITEWLNQVGKAIMQLQFKARIVAFIEAYTIISYIILVWGGYYFWHIINIATVFGALLAVSMSSCICLIIYISKIYWQLPTIPDFNIPTKVSQRMVQNRLFVYGNQILRTLFSTNFLIPFFAAQLGPAFAGTIRITSSISRFISTVVTHMIGSTSSALIARAKYADRLIQTELFNYLAQKMNIVMYGVAIFFIINATSLTNMPATSAMSISWVAVGIFLFINLSDSLLVIYEKLFIIHEKMRLMVAIQIINLSLLYVVLHYASSVSHLTTLTLLLIMRVAYMATVYFASFFIWKLRPSFTISAGYLISYVIIALAFKIIL